MKEVSMEYFITAKQLYEMYKNTGLQNILTAIFNEFVENFKPRAKEAALSGKLFLNDKINLDKWCILSSHHAIFFVHDKLKPYFESKLAAYGYKFMMIYYDEKNIVEYCVSWDVEGQNDN